MPLKRRKRARVHHVVVLAASLLLSCAIVCPVHRFAMTSLLSQDDELSPHSLENQLLKSKNSTATRQFAVSDGGAAANDDSRLKEKTHHATKKKSSEVPKRNTPENSPIIAKESLVSKTGDSDNAAPAAMHDNTESSLGANNITVLSKTLREMVKNSSKRNHPPVSNERLKELHDIADMLRYTNNNTIARTRESVLPQEKQIHADQGKITSKLRGYNKTSIQQVPVPTKGLDAPAVQQTSHRHYPNYFTNQVPLELLKKRMNLVTPYTGCSIAAFQYNLGKHAHPEFNDCFVHCGKPFAKTRGIRVDNAKELVQENDTLFIQFNKLEHFVNKTMNEIDVDYVIMSGNEQKVPPISKETFDAVANNPRVLHWFMMNMDIYSHDLNHPKISPWPYGSNPKKMAFFAEELRKDAPEKNTTIYVSGFSRATNPQRYHIPYGPRVPITQYLSEMRASKYIISPDGDRPECYRHYEAIGMGSMPITQMDAKTHIHLGKNAVYDNTNWNLTTLEETLPQHPQVNRRLIFEEYWMEYVERIVGRPLRWYDPSRDVHSSLAEIQDLVSKDILAPRDEVCVVANGAPFVGHRGPPRDIYLSMLTEET